jgi:hypothetical protein
MQEIPKSVRATVDSINAELRKRPKSERQRKKSVVKESFAASQFGNGQSGLTPNDTKLEMPLSVSP